MVNHTDDTIVVLIPGLWMPAWVMCFLQRKLERVGFRCTRFGYASGRAGLEENSARLAAFVTFGSSAPSEPDTDRRRPWSAVSGCRRCQVGASAGRLSLSKSAAALPS